MLRAMGRHAYRPAHMHFMVQAPGYTPLVTHVFDRKSKYLDSDAVFGVRASLIADFRKRAPGEAPDGQHVGTPYYTLDFDLRLSATGKPREEATMATAKQRKSAKGNIRKAASAARKKRTIAHLPTKTRTALGKEGAKAARKKKKR